MQFLAWLVQLLCRRGCVSRPLLTQMSRSAAPSCSSLWRQLLDRPLAATEVLCTRVVWSFNSTHTALPCTACGYLCIAVCPCVQGLLQSRSGASGSAPPVWLCQLAAIPCMHQPGVQEQQLPHHAPGLFFVDLPSDQRWFQLLSGQIRPDSGCCLNDAFTCS